MRDSPRQDRPAPEPIWRRLDRAAEELNPFLMLTAIGLVLLYLVGAVGLLVKLPITYGSPNAVASTSSGPTTEAVSTSEATAAPEGGAPGQLEIRRTSDVVQ